jgi:Holliday junction resolvase
MSVESNLQSKIIKYLKGKGCYVIKTGGIGTPDGCPDIIALCGGLWIAIEVKSSPTAKYQPLQIETLVKLNDWSWARRVDPANWGDIKIELEGML